MVEGRLSVSHLVAPRPAQHNTTAISARGRGHVSPHQRYPRYPRGNWAFCSSRGAQFHYNPSFESTSRLSFVEFALSSYLWASICRRLQVVFATALTISIYSVRRIIYTAYFH